MASERRCLLCGAFLGTTARSDHECERPDVTPKTEPEVYVNEYEPWYGVLVGDVLTVEAALAAVKAETDHGLPLHYLGIRTEPIVNENGSPGRRRRFHVFTDEPQ